MKDLTLRIRKLPETLRLSLRDFKDFQHVLIIGLNEEQAKDLLRAITDE